MTINEQLKELRLHVEEEDVTELFICVDDWANTPEGKLYAECNDIEEFYSFLEQYGELKCLDWCIISCGYYDGLGIGFVVASTDL
jgi:hypothetical protein